MATAKENPAGRRKPISSSQANFSPPSDKNRREIFGFPGGFFCDFSRDTVHV